MPSAEFEPMSVERIEGGLAPEIHFVVSTPSEIESRKWSTFDSYGAGGAEIGMELAERRRSMTVTVRREVLQRVPFYREKLEGEWKYKDRVHIGVSSTAQLAAVVDVLSHLDRPLDVDVARPCRKILFHMLSLALQIGCVPIQMYVSNTIASNLREDAVLATLQLAQRYDCEPLREVIFRWLNFHCIEPLTGLNKPSREEDTRTLFADSMDASLRWGGQRVTLEPLLRLCRSERDAKRSYWLARSPPQAESAEAAESADSVTEAPIEMVLPDETGVAVPPRPHNPLQSGSEGEGDGIAAAPAVPTAAGGGGSGGGTGALAGWVRPDPTPSSRIREVPMEQWDGDPPYEVGTWPLGPPDPERYSEKEQRVAGKGFPGLFRCYIRRYRHGRGAGKVRTPLQEWGRTVARVLPVSAESASSASVAANVPQFRTFQKQRPSRTKLVDAGYAKVPGVPHHDGAFRHVYELRREDDDALILAAVTESSDGHFLLTRCLSDASFGGPHYLGRVSAALLGTWFRVRDAGIRARPTPSFSLAPRAWTEEMERAGVSSAASWLERSAGDVTREMTRACGWEGWEEGDGEEDDEDDPDVMIARRTPRDLPPPPPLAASIRDTLPAWEQHTLADVSYDTNVMGTVPNSCCVRMWPSGRDARADDELAAGRQVGDGFIPNEPVDLSSRKPKWNERLGAWTMDFQGRATRASKKNFQLVRNNPDGKRPRASDKNADIVFLMGKRGKDVFSLDFGPPLSPVAAMGIAITVFANKWAVA